MPISKIGHSGQTKILLVYHLGFWVDQLRRDLYGVKNSQKQCSKEFQYCCWGYPISWQPWHLAGYTMDFFPLLLRGRMIRSFKYIFLSWSDHFLLRFKLITTIILWGVWELLAVFPKNSNIFHKALENFPMVGALVEVQSPCGIWAGNIIVSKGIWVKAHYQDDLRL